MSTIASKLAGRSCLAVILTGVPHVLAEQAASGASTATGTVYGHVYYAESNAPARMALVVLEPAEAIDEAGAHHSTSTHAMAVQTLLDGSFSIQQVVPGAYYVVATQAGYVSPLALLGISPASMQRPTETLRKQIARSVPRIAIQPNLSGSINLVLEHGAAVSGAVQFEDGSPAVGVQVRVLARRNGTWQPPPSDPFQSAAATAITDDRGAYRIGGLLGQEYVVEVTLQLNKMTFNFDGSGGIGTTSDTVYSVTFYSGSKWRSKDATPFLLKRGEERTGEDVQILSDTLHVVRGTIIASHDGHVINGGEVSLLYADEGSEAFRTSVGRDGVFTFSFVPEGDYRLHLAKASDIEYIDVPNPPHSIPPSRAVPRVIKKYGSTDLPVHVGADVPGLTAAVPEIPGEPLQNIP